eukprot:Gregarina_sp_Poly_1__5991@NODE_3155_length_1331_cov_6_496835_g2005_i0_p1_GENE_NODE_3155_length_1331_cov_6_496835_g2005_i0NODE_3155_length_1331_cov_6_496835_g2005_i0_p1_ORF_typecomplete_len359_score42_83_NODE_3155_length_1331_cov_6_496835_g2005_i0371077
MNARKSNCFQFKSVPESEWTRILGNQRGIKLSSGAPDLLTAHEGTDLVFAHNFSAPEDNHETQGTPSVLRVLGAYQPSEDEHVALVSGGRQACLRNTHMSGSVNLVFFAGDLGDPDPDDPMPTATTASTVLSIKPTVPPTVSTIPGSTMGQTFSTTLEPTSVPILSPVLAPTVAAVSPPNIPHPESITRQLQMQPANDLPLATALNGTPASQDTAPTFGAEISTQTDAEFAARVQEGCRCRVAGNRLGSSALEVNCDPVFAVAESLYTPFVPLDDLPLQEVHDSAFRLGVLQGSQEGEIVIPAVLVRSTDQYPQATAPPLVFSKELIDGVVYDAVGFVPDVLPVYI